MFLKGALRWFSERVERAIAPAPVVNPQPCPREGCRAKANLHYIEGQDGAYAGRDQNGDAVYVAWWVTPSGPPSVCARYRETRVLCHSGVQRTRADALQAWKEVFDE